ncbi:MAG: hypothetical protein ACI8VY_001546, partial [Cellvibrionaceae bacterium]
GVFFVCSLVRGQISLRVKTHLDNQVPGSADGDKRDLLPKPLLTLKGTPDKLYLWQT